MLHPIPRSPLLKSTLDSLAVDVHEGLRASQHVRVGTAELIQEVVKSKQLLLVDMRSQPMLGEHPPGLKRTVRSKHYPPHANEEASDAPRASLAAKCRARCQGPSCEVVEMSHHQRNSPRRSALARSVKSR